MWPVQTLTLLLCLTDEEQLFAQRPVIDEALPAIEVAVPERPAGESGRDFVMEETC